MITRDRDGSTHRKRLNIIDQNDLWLRVRPSESVPFSAGESGSPVYVAGKLVGILAGLAAPSLGVTSGTVLRIDRLNDELRSFFEVPTSSISKPSWSISFFPDIVFGRTPSINLQRPIQETFAVLASVYDIATPEVDPRTYDLGHVSIAEPGVVIQINMPDLLTRSPHADLVPTIAIRPVPLTLHNQLTVRFPDVVSSVYSYKYDYRSSRYYASIGLLFRFHSSIGVGLEAGGGGFLILDRYSLSITHLDGELPAGAEFNAQRITGTQPEGGPFLLFGVRMPLGNHAAIAAGADFFAFHMTNPIEQNRTLSLVRPYLGVSYELSR